MVGTKVGTLIWGEPLRCAAAGSKLLVVARYVFFSPKIPSVFLVSVVITDVNSYRLALAEKIGVTLAVNSGVVTLKEVQEKLCMQEGFDVGLEMSGNPAAFRETLQNMSHGAKIAMLGIPCASSKPGGFVESSTWKGSRSGCFR